MYSSVFHCEFQTISIKLILEALSTSEYMALLLRDFSVKPVIIKQNSDDDPFTSKNMMDMPSLCVKFRKSRAHGHISCPILWVLISSIVWICLRKQLTMKNLMDLVWRAKKVCLKMKEKASWACNTRLPVTHIHQDEPHIISKKRNMGYSSGVPDKTLIALQTSWTIQTGLHPLLKISAIMT